MKLHYLGKKLFLWLTIVTLYGLYWLWYLVRMENKCFIENPSKIIYSPRPYGAAPILPISSTHSKGISKKPGKRLALAKSCIHIL
jgi:hypothetical protein